MAIPPTISAAVEGKLDEAVAQKLIRHAGALPGTIYGKRGKQALKARMRGYIHAARHAPWLVLVDLDCDHDCAPPLRQAWVTAGGLQLCFRVAVRQVEAWLMADAERLASFLQVPRAVITATPEVLVDSKAEMVDVARRSRRRDIREDMVPREGSGRPVGPAYSSRLIELAETDWRPSIAAARSESLRGAIACLERLVARA